MCDRSKYQSTRSLAPNLSRTTNNGIENAPVPHDLDVLLTRQQMHAPYTITSSYNWQYGNKTTQYLPP